MSGYTFPSEPLQLIRSPAIDALFDRTPGWFSRDRVRKRLYAQGFPRPVTKGRWLRSAVIAWIERAGSIPGNQRPAPRRRRHAPNGYTP